MFSVHTTPEKFENGIFTPKTQQMSFVHTTPEKFENATITGDRNHPRGLGLITSFSKTSVFKTLPLHAETENRVFVNVRFRSGLVRTVVLTVEIKLRFEISQA